MRMIRILLILLGAFLFSSFINIDRDTEILLMSKESPMKRSASIQPYVKAYLSENAIKLHFYADLGKVKVLITSDNGDVTQTTIDANTACLSLIDIPYTEGDNHYTIELSTETDLLEGEFNL